MSTKTFRFFLILGLYFIVLGIIRSFGSLEYDDAEQLLLAKTLHLGYPNAQPPLYNSLQWLFFQIFGVSKAALVLLKHLLLFGIYISLYFLAKTVSGSENRALWAVVLSLFLPQLLWQSELMLTHSILATLLGVWFFWCVAKLLKQPTFWCMVGLGVISALGVLGKYSFVLLPLAFSILWLVELRKKIPLSWLLASIILFFALLSPHLWWLVEHWNMVEHATLAKTIHHKNGLLELCKSTVAFLTPFWIVWLFVKKEPLDDLAKNLLAIQAIIFLFLLIAIFVGVADSFKERWFLPFLTPLPAILASSYPNQPPKRMLFVAYSLLIGMIVFFSVRIFLPDLIHPTNSNLPIETLAKKLHPKSIQSDNVVLKGNFELYVDPTGKNYTISKTPKPGYKKICTNYLHSNKNFCLYYKEIR